MKFGIKRASAWAFAVAAASAAIALAAGEKPWPMVRGPALAQVFADRDFGGGYVAILLPAYLLALGLSMLTWAS